MIAVVAVLLGLLTLVPANAGTSAVRPPIALSASPSRVTLNGSSRATVRLTNVGARAVVVDVGRAGFALDLRGRPEIVAHGDARAAVRWLTLQPRSVALRPGQSGSLIVTSKLPGRAEPGDHDALLLMTTRPQRRAGVAVRMRIGVVVVVRAPGKVVRALVPRALRVERRARPVRLLDLLVANRGNVTEMLGRDQLEVVFARGGRTIARLGPDPRELRPHTSGLVQLVYRGRLRGSVSARVRITLGRLVVRRTFRIRL